MVSTSLLGTGGISQRIINLKAQRLNSKGVGKVARLAKVRYVHGIAHLSFAVKWSLHQWVSDRNCVADTYFLYENQCSDDNFCIETEGPARDSFCDCQHVRNLISVHK